MAVNVDAMEQRYNKHYQTLEQLTALYRQEGIRLMLLKGLGLRRLSHSFTSRRGDIIFISSAIMRKEIV